MNITSDLKLTKSAAALALGGCLTVAIFLASIPSTANADLETGNAAVSWFRKAAEQGEASAQYNLGVMFEHGRGVVKDEKTAVSWYRKAAEQGHENAQSNLGAFYEHGKGGLLQDHAQAARLYEQAAVQGDAYGQRNLARLLRDGRGVGQQRIQAHAWFNLAAAAEATHPKTAQERDVLGRQLSASQLAEAQRLARSWRVGEKMGRAKVR